MPVLMCPNCEASMQTVTRSGVEFDMCSKCRGVWLDRGELEKLVTLGRDEPYADEAGAARHSFQDRRRARDDDDDHMPERGRGRRGFNIFDIFD